MQRPDSDSVYLATTLDEAIVAPATKPRGDKQETPDTRRNRRAQGRANARAAKRDSRDILRRVARTDRCPCQDIRRDGQPAPDCFICYGTALVVTEQPLKMRRTPKRH